MHRRMTCIGQKLARLRIGLHANHSNASARLNSGPVPGTAGTDLSMARPNIGPAFINGLDFSSTGTILIAFARREKAVVTCFADSFRRSIRGRCLCLFVTGSKNPLNHVTLFSGKDVTGYDSGSARCYAIFMSDLSYLHVSKGNTNAIRLE